ncbi:MAG TPA: DNA polymerase Y family protein [Terracidiphilus sp.]|jgi:protein ImuB|nr:DNA polymerase Y family protein [Terracidiphilus sp.]
MTSSLYACIHAEDFPVQSLLRLRPDLKAEAVAVLDGIPPQQTICSYNQHAYQCGVAQGMTRREAECLSGLKLLPRNKACESATRAVVQECSGQFSPRVQEIPGNTTCTFVLDIGGSERLFGPPEKLAHRLRNVVASAGIRTSVTISANYQTSRLMAMSTRSVCVVPSGEEAVTLASLPISILDLDEAHYTTFVLWGIRTLGELAELPEIELVTRLGPAGKTFRDLARGIHGHTFCPIEPTFTLQESFEFEHPVEQADSLLFLGARMIDCLTERATMRALCLASIAVKMTLANGRSHSLTIKPAIPSADRKFLLKLLQLELASHPPQAAVLALTLLAEAGQSSKVQLGLFTPQMPEPSRLDVTLARLKALVGEDRVGSPLLADSHQSNQFRMEGFSIESKAPSAPGTRTSMTLRRVRPPCPVYVLLQSDKPVAFRYRNCRYAVASAYGPWKSAGAWWSTDSWNAEEWDILAQTENSVPVTCLLVHHPEQHRWQLEALYD